MNYNVAFFNGEEILTKEILKFFPVLDIKCDMVEVFSESSADTVVMKGSEQIKTKKFDNQELSKFDFVIFCRPFENLTNVPYLELEKVNGYVLMESFESKDESLNLFPKQNENKNCVYNPQSVSFIASAILEKLKKNQIEVTFVSINSFHSISNFGNFGVNKLYRDSIKYFEATAVEENKGSQNYNHTLIKKDISFNFLPFFGMQANEKRSMLQSEFSIKRDLLILNPEVADGSVMINSFQLPTFRGDGFTLEIETRDGVTKSEFIEIVRYISEDIILDEDLYPKNSGGNKDAIQFTGVYISKVQIAGNKVSCYINYDNITYSANRILKIIESLAS